MARIWDWMKTIRFSDNIISLAFEEGPQIIDYGQGVAAVILTLEEYQRLSGETIDLSQKTTESPWELLQEKRAGQDLDTMLDQINESNRHGSIWDEWEHQSADQTENIPKPEVPSERAPGLFSGKIEMSKDFDAPMELVDSQPEDEKPTPRPAPGLDAGQIEIEPDFDDPLDEFDAD